MKITEVRIKLIDRTEDRLRGFCSITFNDMFVVRDLKIIEGNNGPFVAMPSRKLTTNCHSCRTKNHLRASYCNQCGAKLKANRIEQDNGGRAKLYADVAHPVNAKCRELIQKRVIEELEKEIELSLQPGYSSKYDDDYFDDDPGPIPSDSSKPSKSNSRNRSLENKRLDEPNDHQRGPHKPEETIQKVDSAEDDFGKGVFE